MFRNINFFLSTDVFSAPEIGFSVPVPELIQSRHVQAELKECLSGRGVVIHLSSALCACHRVLVWQVNWPVWRPDPLVYLPVLDALDRADIRVSGVTLSGRRPYFKWVMGVWIGVAIGVGIIGVASAMIGQQVRRLDVIVADQQGALARRDANRRYVQQVNDRLFAQVAQLIQGVRAVQGVVVLAAVNPNHVDLQILVPDDQVEAAVAWVKTVAPQAAVIPVAEGWAMVHAE